MRIKVAKRNCGKCNTSKIKGVKPSKLFCPLKEDCAQNNTNQKEVQQTWESWRQTEHQDEEFVLFFACAGLSKRLTTAADGSVSSANSWNFFCDAFYSVQEPQERLASARIPAAPRLGNRSFSTSRLRVIKVLSDALLWNWRWWSTPKEGQLASRPTSACWVAEIGRSVSEAIEACSS